MSESLYQRTIEHSDKLLSLYENCTLCPRNCHANRRLGKKGYCGQSDVLRAARAALHFWEEPILSGTEGSGTVFFSGCNLRCIFCQNQEIALGEVGREITLERLAQIFLELQEKGANNINLVTATPYIPHIVLALSHARLAGLSIPVVYNSGGYEALPALQLLSGFVQIYLPDLKYVSSDLSGEFSYAPDYFRVASLALDEMYRQVGDPVLSGDHLMQGMIVRHLLLPGQSKDTKKVLRYLHETYGDHIYVSIMNQYTPLSHVLSHPVLGKKVAPEEYAKVLSFAERLGIRRGFIQEGDVATESFIPAFNGEGL